MKKIEAILSCLLALALLAGCGSTARPAESAQPTAAPAQETAAPASAGGEIRVSSVDELLAAIAPNAVIVLEKGDYVLSEAAGYGQTPSVSYYDWDALEDGQYELIISHADNLTLRVEEAGAARLFTAPRLACLICFDGCRHLRLEGLTAGHTDGTACSGGVLRLERCEDAVLSDCSLFGCGTVGLEAKGCSALHVLDSRIFECSDSAVRAEDCEDLRVERCELYGHGRRPVEGLAGSLFQARGCHGFRVYGSRIYDNRIERLFECAYTRDAFFLSNEVSGNDITEAAFTLLQYPCVTEGCSFDGNELAAWVADKSLAPVDAEGQALDGAALEHMALRDCEIDLPFPTLSGERKIEPGDTVTVRSVDELLQALGPDRTIVLDGARFDLSTAEGYGLTGSDYYCWVEEYDGPKLVIQNVTGLTIRAQAEDAAATTLCSVPRYADVLFFRDCSELTLSGFTVGHTTEPGECSGGVLCLDNCQDVSIERCRLYGCGIMGLTATRCTGLSLSETEIYDCSYGGVSLYRCRSVSFEGCLFRNLPSPQLSFSDCRDLSWNGETVCDGSYDVSADGKLTASAQG